MTASFSPPSGPPNPGNPARLSRPPLPLDLRSDFPLLARPGERPLHYLDNAATAQKPLAVIEAVRSFYADSYGTVRRGVYRLAEKATFEYEATRRKAAALLGAASEKEIVFTSGATQSLNLIAYSYGRAFVGPGDEIVLSEVEHHANIVPWQMVAEERGASLKIIPVLDNGELDLAAYENLLSSRTKVVAVGHVSNALGTIHDVPRIARLAHAAGAVVVVDGAQGAPHLEVDVKALGADFYVFSGHKIFGPTGVGILYGRYDLLEKMPPYQRGGDMIARVTFAKTTFQDPPHRFEAGTPPIAEVIGLGAALDYVVKVGLPNIAAHEGALLDYATERLGAVPGLRLIGTAPRKAAVASFYLDAVHPHDLATLLDEDGVAIRAGHHCAQPTMDRFGVPATARASFGPYNTYEDVDALLASLTRALEIFG